MLQDLNDLGDDAFEGRYDLIVAGTGPAGMTVAMIAAERGARVLLLEAGALQSTPESRDVYKGRSIGQVNYGHIEGCRLRQFGGTSGHWAGRCALFDPIDFEDRPVFGMPGWPISREEAYCRLDKAKEILEISDWAGDSPVKSPWEESRFRTAEYALSPTRFGNRYRETIEQSDRIQCVYNANVTDLKLGEDGKRIAGAVITSYDGRQYTVSAERYVIAFGAMENARFLLNANKQMPNGLGNQNDWVGRTFMEHFQVTLGTFVMRNDPFWQHMLDNERGTVAVLPSEELMRQANIGNGTIAMSPSEGQRFHGRLAPLRKTRRNIVCAVTPLRVAAQAEDSRVICPGDGKTGTITEHLPNRDSRIILNPDETDQFGNRRLQLAYNLRDDDLRTMRQQAIELGKSIANLDVGRFRVDGEVLGGQENVFAHCHHMGTTRMAARAEDGVVDENCRVHGIDNLYMGGSSVFSTGGGANPTLTIVSLAVRLGEHLTGGARCG